jgi:hypothetical protein
VKVLRPVQACQPLKAAGHVGDRSSIVGRPSREPIGRSMKPARHALVGFRGQGRGSFPPNPFSVPALKSTFVRATASPVGATATAFTLESAQIDSDRVAHYNNELRMTDGEGVRTRKFPDEQSGKSWAFVIWISSRVIYRFFAFSVEWGHQGNPKARNPKSERSSKSEIRDGRSPRGGFA